MTYAEASHLSLAIRKCVTRCCQSREPYTELSNFIMALREGGVSEHYVQAINRAALREIAASMIASAPVPANPAAAPNTPAIPPKTLGVPASYCYILQ